MPGVVLPLDFMGRKMIRVGVGGSYGNVALNVQYEQSLSFLIFSERCFFHDWFCLFLGESTWPYT